MTLFIFDMDDTLYYSDGFREARSKAIIGRVADKFNLSFDEALNKYNQTKLDLAANGEKASSTYTYVALGFSKDDFYATLNAVRAEGIIGEDKELADFLSDFSKKHELVVLSGSSIDSVNNVLDCLGIKDFFKKAYSSQMFAKAKPSSLPYQEIIKDWNTTSEETVVVGNNVYKDLIPGKKIGTKTVLVDLTGVKDTTVDIIESSDEEIKSNVDYKIKSLLELNKYF